MDLKKIKNKNKKIGFVFGLVKFCYCFVKDISLGVAIGSSTQIAMFGVSSFS